MANTGRCTLRRIENPQSRKGRYEIDCGGYPPTHIIATSLEVAKTLHVLKDEGKITADTGLRLRHPRWCGINRNYDAGLQEYMDVLGRFIKPAAKGQGG